MRDLEIEHTRVLVDVTGSAPTYAETPYAALVGEFFAVAWAHVQLSFHLLDES